MGQNYVPKIYKRPPAVSLKSFVDPKPVELWESAIQSPSNAYKRLASLKK